MERTRRSVAPPKRYSDGGFVNNDEKEKEDEASPRVNIYLKPPTKENAEKRIIKSNYDNKREAALVKMQQTFSNIAQLKRDFPQPDIARFADYCMKTTDDLSEEYNKYPIKDPFIEKLIYNQRVLAGLLNDIMGFTTGVAFRLEALEAETKIVEETVRDIIS